MKTKTTITLSSELLQAIDNLTRQPNNRSKFIETALWLFIKQLRKKDQELKDLEILNKKADYFNKQAQDVLSYQVSI